MNADPATVREGDAYLPPLAACKGVFRQLCSLWRAFMQGLRNDRALLLRKEKELRDTLSERQIDKMVEDSFPASDPPSTY